MLYYANGGPGPADKLLRVNVNGDGGDYETWRNASADRWSARGGWEPYPNAQLDIQFLGEYFMVDESEVPLIQAHLRELAEKFPNPWEVAQRIKAAQTGPDSSASQSNLG